MYNKRLINEINEVLTQKVNSNIGRPRVATKTFFEDLVIDTPETAANFIKFLEEGKVLEVKGPVIEDADLEFIRSLAEIYGFKK